jgi:predicted cobalt transporter CbtA
MRLDSFGAIVKSALVAGLGAGLLVAAVQFVWSEPVVDHAIALEGQLHAAENAHSAAAAAPAEETPIVDRPTQKKGLFLGYTIYGLAWGLLFGAAYTIGQQHLPARGRFGRGFLLAAGSFWAVGLLPFLKYPANPPGVGDPNTIDFRQHAYLGMLVGGIAVVILALALRHALSQQGSRPATIVAPLALIAVGSAALYFALPANTDAIRMPASLVTEFRVHSLAGLALFWLTLGCLFGPILAWLTAGDPRSASASVRTSTAR